MRRSRKIIVGSVATVIALGTSFRLRYGSRAPVFDEALYAVDPAPYRPFDARAWTRVLAGQVDREGHADFAALVRDRADLERFLRQAAFLEPGELAAMPAVQRLGFWIDVYNAGVVRAVAVHYPIEADPLLGVVFPRSSVQQLHRSKFFRREQLLVAGERVTLQEIEDEKIWNASRDPRAFFALHRAAQSSPPLARTPYVEGDTAAKLDEQARAFLATERGVRWNAQRRVLALSRLFEWNEARFLEALGSGEEIPGFKAEGAAMLRFVLRYGLPEHQEAIRRGGYALDAFGFDWTLAEAR